MDLFGVVAVCDACRIGGAAVDFKCVDCCVRLLLKEPRLEMRKALIQSMEKFGDEEHGDRIRKMLAAAWKKRKTTNQPKRSKQHEIGRHA